VPLLFSSCTRSLTITKEYRLTNFQIESFTFDVWSYGNWVSSKSGNLITESYEPPYTILLAIRKKDNSWDGITILSSIVTHAENNLDILHKLAKRTDAIKEHRASAFKEPYAVFNFSDAIEFNGDFILNIKFIEAGNNNKVFKHSLKIQYSEEHKKSFTFWDALMGV
jgi:hypothetical protein